MLDTTLQSQDTQRTGFLKRLRRRRYFSATALCLAAALLVLFTCVALLLARSSAVELQGLEGATSFARLARGTAATLTIVIVLAAIQLRSLVRLRSNYERQLTTQAAILKTVVDEIPTSVALWDRELRYRLVNKAFERWRGRDREDVIGRTVAEVVGPEEFALSKPWIDRALNGENVTYEKQYDRSAVRRVSASYSPLVAEDGSVIGIVAMAHDITTHHRERERLLQLSERDSLTGLLNRLAFEEWIADACRENGGRDLAVLYIDLDNFKPVNDEFGHTVGDLVLGEFAKRLSAVVRPTDAIARLGGDEFAIALPGVRCVADAEMIAQKVVAEAGRPMQVDGRTIQIGASVGVAVDATRERDGGRGLIKRADEMLYGAKRSGRGRVCSQAE